MKEIILIGGGGHCHSVIDVIESEGLFKITGIVDSNKEKGSKVLGYSVLGGDEILEDLASKIEYALVTVGQIESPKSRMNLFDYLRELGFKLPVVISPKAHVSKYATVGDGTVVMHFATINANARIGKNCILNTYSLCEHDVEVGDHCHLSTGAILNGGCILGKGSFIGSRSVFKENSEIPALSLIPYGEKR